MGHGDRRAACGAVRPRRLGARRGVLRGRQDAGLGELRRHGEGVGSAAADGELRHWLVDDSKKAEFVKELEVLRAHKGPGRSLTFLPGIGRLVTGGDDGRLRVWDLEGGKKPSELTGHTAEVRSVSFWPFSQ